MSFKSKIQSKYKVVGASNHDYFTSDDLEEFESLLEDYKEVKNPNPKIRAAAKSAIKECLSDFPFWDRIALYYSDDTDKLGHLRGETESRPIIILSPKNIVSAAKQVNVSLEDTVMTTIYHEFGHAVVRLADMENYEFKFDDEEEFVEAFARGRWSGRGSDTEDQFATFLQHFTEE